MDNIATSKVQAKINKKMIQFVKTQHLSQFVPQTEKNPRKNKFLTTKLDIWLCDHENGGVSVVFSKSWCVMGLTHTH